MFYFSTMENCNFSMSEYGESSFEEYDDMSFERESPPKEKTHLQLYLGSRVQVYWPDEQAWFQGAIRNMNHPQYYIQYDDGDEQWEVHPCRFIIL
jgi:hypothetical protein